MPFVDSNKTPSASARASLVSLLWTQAFVALASLPTANKPPAPKRLAPAKTKDWS